MESMNPTDILAGANGFFLHFAAAIILTGLFALSYLWITPYAEFKLIREGKTAPALAFSAALLGFVLALAGAVCASAGVRRTTVCFCRPVPPHCRRRTGARNCTGRALARGRSAECCLHDLLIFSGCRNGAATNNLIVIVSCLTDYTSRFMGL
jgi:heme A synthase